VTSEAIRADREFALANPDFNPTTQNNLETSPNGMNQTDEVKRHSIWED
jgi:hypothetical protein